MQKCTVCRCIALQSASRHAHAIYIYIYSTSSEFFRHKSEKFWHTFEITPEMEYNQEDRKKAPEKKNQDSEISKQGQKQVYTQVFPSPISCCHRYIYIYHWVQLKSHSRLAKLYKPPVCETVWEHWVCHTKIYLPKKRCFRQRFYWPDISWAAENISHEMFPGSKRLPATLYCSQAHISE